MLKFNYLIVINKVNVLTLEENYFSIDVRAIFCGISLMYASPKYEKIKSLKTTAVILKRSCKQQHISCNSKYNAMCHPKLYYIEVWQLIKKTPYPLHDRVSECLRLQNTYVYLQLIVARQEIVATHLKACLDSYAVFINILQKYVNVNAGELRTSNKYTMCLWCAVLCNFARQCI